MPENIRALVVVLALATTVFVIVRAPARAMAQRPGDFERRRNLWFGITLAAFLSYNFWLFMGIAAVLLHQAATKEKNIIAMVMFVLLAMPLIGLEIPGFAGIRYLFKLDYLMLISLVVFLPIFVRTIKQHSLKHFADETVDWYLYSYIVLNITLWVFAGGDFTGTGRNAFLYFMGMALPYAIASREIKTDAALRAAIACYVLGASVMAAVGIVEAMRGWLMYTSIEKAMGINWGMTIYLRRGNSLRAFASTGQAIVFGYAMAVGLMLLLGLRRHFSRKIFWYGGLALLFIGMLSSYSRGPWLGAAAGYFVFIISGPKRWSNIARLAVVGVVAGALLLASPLGEKLYNSAVAVDEGSYDYRVKVFEVSMRVIMQNPLFGTRDANTIDQLEELRQGQGIIDIVNSYVAVALQNGLIGLSLFVGFFASAIHAIFKRIRRLQDSDCEAMDLGRCLLAALTCILVSIYTVSSILIVPIVYYLMAGLAVAYARCERLAPADTEGAGTISLSLRELRSRRTRRARLSQRPFGAANDRPPVR